MSSQKKILLLSPQDEKMLRQLGLEDDTLWFRDALANVGDRIDFKSVHIPTQGLPEQYDFDAVIIGGSSLSTYREGRPWIREAENFIMEIIKKDIPLLGVCFGHQLVAQALGGRVGENEKGLEFGTKEVGLTLEGEKDPLFKGLPPNFKVQEAHRDIIKELPPLKEARVLAENKNSAFQSLSLGKNTRTVQFHPEFTPSILEGFARIRKEKFQEWGLIKNDRQWREFKASFRDTPEARQVLSNFYKEFVRGA